ncbi:MAG: hypothetical protein PHU05_00755 [Bacilli bacterium]|nr:hypothetical protein [Bacilli bacterium]
MMINEVATWFYKNNEKVRIDETDVLIRLLCLCTKTAFLIEDEVKMGPMKLQLLNNNSEVKVIVDITEAIDNYPFTDKQLRILKTINRNYGYDDITELLNHICEQDFFTNNLNELEQGKIVEIKDDELESTFGINVKKVLENYKDYDFKEEVLIIGKNTFFVKIGTNLTEEEKENLKNKNIFDQNQFDVFRSEDGVLVVY